MVDPLALAVSPPSPSPPPPPRYIPALCFLPAVTFSTSFMACSAYSFPGKHFLLSLLLPFPQPLQPENVHLRSMLLQKSESATQDTKVLHCKSAARAMVYQTNRQQSRKYTNADRVVTAARQTAAPEQLLPVGPPCPLDPQSRLRHPAPHPAHHRPGKTGPLQGR